MGESLEEWIEEDDYKIVKDVMKNILKKQVQEVKEESE